MDRTALLRWVVLRHEGVAAPHYDLMFEVSHGARLLTFRTESWPLVLGDTAVRAEDHRTSYLDYEGEISGGRGFVRRVASGRLRRLELGERELRVELDPEGVVHLVRDAEDGAAWSCRTAPLGFR